MVVVQQSEYTERHWTVDPGMVKMVKFMYILVIIEKKIFWREEKIGNYFT